MLSAYITFTIHESEYYSRGSVRSSITGAWRKVTSEVSTSWPLDPGPGGFRHSTTSSLRSGTWIGILAPSITKLVASPPILAEALPCQEFNTESTSCSTPFTLANGKSQYHTFRYLHRSHTLWTGYTGSHIVDILLSQGYQVHRTACVSSKICINVAQRALGGKMSVNSNWRWSKI